THSKISRYPSSINNNTSLTHQPEHRSPVTTSTLTIAANSPHKQSRKMPKGMKRLLGKLGRNDKAPTTLPPRSEYLNLVLQASHSTPKEIKKAKGVCSKCHSIGPGEGAMALVRTMACCKRMLHYSCLVDWMLQTTTEEDGKQFFKNTCPACDEEVYQKMEVPPPPPPPSPPVSYVPRAFALPEESHQSILSFANPALPIQRRYSGGFIPPNSSNEEYDPAAFEDAMVLAPENPRVTFSIPPEDLVRVHRDRFVRIENYLLGMKPLMLINFWEYMEYRVHKLNGLVMTCSELISRLERHMDEALTRVINRQYEDPDEAKGLHDFLFEMTNEDIVRGIVMNVASQTDLPGVEDEISLDL
ncbi:uncharacterized protein K452DRAFT_339584, partial [Aplosporella prunicola CBS 121167]